MARASQLRAPPGATFRGAVANLSGFAVLRDLVPEHVMRMAMKEILRERRGRKFWTTASAMKCGSQPVQQVTQKIDRLADTWPELARMLTPASPEAASPARFEESAIRRELAWIRMRDGV